MAEDRDALLRNAWVCGRVGTLSGQAVAKVWALREVWRDEKTSDWGMYEYIAGKVEKVGGGHPGRQAVRMLLSKMDADPEWYPGKVDGAQPGPASVISGTNQAVIARRAVYGRGLARHTVCRAQGHACP